ncbi:hypothetical protein T09_2904 [Trichinella sp. T9]|nr:hypothetical protein T09_2904 [Trichinella sp. T9]
MRHADALISNLCILNPFYPSEPDGYGSSDTIFTYIFYCCCLPPLLFDGRKGKFWRNCAQGKCRCEKLCLNMVEPIIIELNVHEWTEETADQILIEELLSKSNVNKDVLSEKVEDPLKEKLNYSKAITIKDIRFKSTLI